MLKAGEYFRCIKKDDDIVVGTLVLIQEIAEKEISFGCLKTTYNSDIDSFLKHFEHEPKGREQRQQQINELVNEIDTFNAKSERLLITVSEEEQSTSTAMVVADKWALKQQDLNKAKIQLQKIEQDMLTKQEKLKALLSEKKNAFEHSLAKFKEKVGKIEETIWSLNLYLGIGEQVVQLRDGERCLATDKVKIRQKLLFMDEECVINAEKGGIDFQKIEEFDKWLLRKDHLKQVLPENKGIVALRVRRKEKDYGDPWSSAAANHENMKTYFLIRNGQCVWRVYATINTGDVLFPRSDDFDEFFYDRWFDKKPLRPGSIEFAKSMKAADAKRRHYLRILLVLQGLFDRTEVFAPFEGDRVNICDRRESEQVLEFIKDDENLLSDGRPRFFEWLRDMNSRLDVGHRIIGVFDNYDYGLPRRKQHEHGRIIPRSACYPGNNELHTIEEKDRDGDFIIRYERDEEIYVRSRFWSNESRKPKVRASCRLEPTDKCFIAFDVATVEDIEFYLNSRIDRHNYIALVPLLHKCLELKEQEQKTEAPFKKMLVGLIAKKFEVEIAKVEKEIDEYISFYKFQFKTHRALTKNDTNAVNMIMADYGARLKQSRVRAIVRLSFIPLMQKIHSQLRIPIDGVVDDRVMYIGHKKDNLFVSYEAMNDENVFVCEKTWKRRGKGVELQKTRPWVIVDKRFERWLSLHNNERWESWVLNPRLTSVFTDMEREEARKQVFEKLNKNLYDKCFLPLAITWVQKQGIMQVHWSDGDVKDGTFATINVKISRTKDGITTELFGSCHYCDFDGDFEKWIDSDLKKYCRDHGLIIWSDYKNIEQYKRKLVERKESQKKQSEISEKADALVGFIQKQMYDTYMVDEYAKFTTSNHVSLWEKHKKDIEPNFRLWWFERRIQFLFEKGHDMTGKTVGEALELCAKLGYKDPKKVWHEQDEERTEIPRELRLIEVKNAREPVVQRT